MSATKALDFARSRLGYYAPRDPLPGSEAGRWAAAKLGQPWLAGPSRTVWWCMCFASMCVYEGGGTLPGGISYNTDDTVGAARRAGLLVPRTSARPGDLAIFDWNYNTAKTDHVGIIEANPGDGTLVCIEGNTSPGVAGSQIAGNGVFRRRRAASLVRYVVRPVYGPDANPAPPTRQALDVDGIGGPKTVAELIRQLGTTPDNRITGQLQRWRGNLYAFTAISYTGEGSPAVRELQRRLGVTADGYMGVETIKALQRRLGVTADGYVGTETMKALQRALNAGAVARW